MKNMTNRNKIFVFCVLTVVFGYVYGVIVAKLYGEAYVLLHLNSFILNIQQYPFMTSILVGPAVVILCSLCGFSLVGSGGIVSLLFFYAAHTAMRTSLICMHSGLKGLLTISVEILPTSCFVLFLLCLCGTDSMEFSMDFRHKTDNEFSAETRSFVESCGVLIALSFLPVLWTWRILPMITDVLY